MYVVGDIELHCFKSPAASFRTIPGDADSPRPHDEYSCSGASRPGDVTSHAQHPHEDRTWASKPFPIEDSQIPTLKMRKQGHDQGGLNSWSSAFCLQLDPAAYSAKLGLFQRI